MSILAHACRTMALAAIVTALPTVSAQEEPSPALFKAVAPEATDLTPKQTLILQKLAGDKTVVETTLVKLNPAALEADSLTMMLDKDSQETLQRTSLREFGKERFLWSGGLAEKTDEKQPPRYARFIFESKRIQGSYFDRKYVYSVKPLGDGLHVIVKHDSSKAPNDEPPAFEKAEKAASEKPAPAAPAPQADIPPSADSAPEITVLVAYTPQVEENHVSVPAFANTVVDLTNNTYAESNIPCRLKIVDVVKVQYSESGSLEQDVDSLSGTNDGAIDDIHQLRDQKLADIVVLMLDSGDAAGYADAILADPTTAFAVVDDEYADWYFTFAHEIGHLFGARHNVAADPTQTPFPYGHGYFDSSNDFRTVMSYACPGGNCTRVGLWSGPNNQHQGHVAGTAQSEDNARVLRERAAAMAAFR